MKKKTKKSRRELYDDGLLPYDYNMEEHPECDVESGSWILITRTVDVSESCRPMLYGIYWGIPHNDMYGRQCCKIRTTEDVVVLNHEYTVVSENKLQVYREEGWELRETSKVSHEMNIKLIEDGRNLCEEEREVIWALQLDGLDEEQACEEYFLSRHTDRNNYTICYLPNQSTYNELVAIFGER